MRTKQVLRFSIILCTLFYIYLAFFLEREQFIPFIFCMLLLFAQMVFIWRDQWSIKQIQWLGIFYRLLFLFSMPALSDDFYRFLWDGMMNLNGVNPFDSLPSEVNLSFQHKELLLQNMNSPDYYSIYPPISQLTYTLGALGLKNSLALALILLKLPIFFAEVGIVLLLPKMLKALHFNPNNSVFYILNPLVIVETVGNLHFEGIMVLFLALAVYSFIQKKDLLGAILLGFACSVKLLTLMLLPLMLVKYPIKRAMTIYVVTLVVFVLSWLPFYNSNAVLHFLASFQLYFQTFEFNASLYYVFREIGYYLYGYNIIQSLGKILPMMTLIILLLVMWRKKVIDWSSFFIKAMFVFIVYYGLASIVHPWYVILPLFLSLFTPYRSVVLWSFLILLSYSAYQFQGVKENYFLIALEYMLFGGYLSWELLTKSRYQSMSQKD